VGILVAIQGFIALVDDDYYLQGSTTVTDNLTTWGWVLLIWGAIVAIAGWALIAAKGWARWFAIFAVSVNLIVQLGFDDKAGGYLWSLVVITPDIIILYALIAHWQESKAEMTGGTRSR
jgi:uncharacterized membrane protein (DUF2068 family)